MVGQVADDAEQQRLTRSMLRSNIANTSAWPTPPPSSTPASMSVTSARAA